MLRFLWRAAHLLWRSTRGYRLCPWRSPYLRWRMETYWGVPAGQIGFNDFWRFIWQHRRDLTRFLAWAQRMR
jgi:hypothetical protein